MWRVIVENNKTYLLFLSILIFPYSNLLAQINIIDVPTSEIVDKDNLFFQEEITIGNRNIKSSTTFTWGFGKNFEAGFNVYQITFNTRPHSERLIINSMDPENNPDFLINAKKGFKANDWMQYAIGTQTGINIVHHRSDLQILNFSYVNTELSIPDTENSLTLGSFYANQPYGGDGSKVGIMAGAQVEIFKDKLSLISDMHTGTSSLAVLNTGIEISLPKKWKLDLAYQLPMPGSNNNSGGLIQVSRNN
jgi:hypothetical protein